MMRVCELIVSSRPLEMLTEPAYEGKQTRPASSANRPAQVVLYNGAQIHLELSQCPTAASTLTHRSTIFEVMGVLDDGYDILVPGYGQCWVKRDDVVSEVPLSEKTARNLRRLREDSITKSEIHLICSQRDDQTRGLQVLLKLVGGPLTHLHFSAQQFQVFGGRVGILSKPRQSAYPQCVARLIGRCP